MVHSAELIREVNVTYHGRPDTDSILPTVAVDSHIGIVFTWSGTWLVDSPLMILLLVDFNSQVDHLVVEVNFDTSGGFHDLLVLRENHVLSEVILGVKLGQVVTGYLVWVKVRTRNRYHICIHAFVCAFVAAIHIDRASELLILVIFIHFLIVIDDSRFLVESEADDSQLIRSCVEGDHIVEGAIKLAHSEYLVAIQNY